MLELLQENPKAASVIRSWFLDRMLESLKDDSIPEDFKEHVRQQGIEDERVAKILGNNPRALFDVLDANKLYIKIDVFVREDGTAKFNWSVNATEGGSSFYSSRTEAEKDAVKKAFEMLNKKL